MKNRTTPLLLACLALSVLSAAAQPGNDEKPGPSELRFGESLWCDYDAELVREKSGAFYENRWPNGVLPYEFVTGSTDSVRSDTLTDVTFSIPFSGPQLSSPTGFRPGFDLWDIVRVQGSQRNDNRDLKIVERIWNASFTRITTLRVELQPGFGFSAESPNGSAVRFFTTESVSEENQARFEDAKTWWEDVADVTIRPKQQGDNGYLQISSSTRNRVAGDVGYGTGARTLEMDAWWSPGVIVHEVGHSLGLKHEHQRPDRNSYVSVDTSIATPTGDANLVIDNSITIYPNLFYDYGSIMHYSQNAFLQNGATGPVIQILDAGQAAIWQTNMGQRDSLSYWDEKTMSFLYPYWNWVFLNGNSADPVADGDFLSPYKSLATAHAATPTGGRLIVTHPRNYTGPGVYSKRMVIEAPQGGVTISGN